MFTEPEVTQVPTGAGLIDVFDSGGSGPTVVFGHGLVMNHTQWRAVIDELAPDVRCIVPVLPLGGHRRPMRDDADLSMSGIAGLLGEVIEQVADDPVVLAGNDWGGPQLIAADRPELFAGLVLTPQEAFDNYPPGLPGKFAAAVGRVPGGLTVAGWSLRLPGGSRLPFTFGHMAARPIPGEMIRHWTHGLLTEAGVRRDVRRYIASTPTDVLIEGAEKLRGFPKPAKVIWCADDRVMPRQHGRALAELLDDCAYSEFDDCSVLMPLDRPVDLADEIRDLVDRVARR